MSDKTLPEPKYDKKDSHGATLGREYATIEQLFIDQRTFVHHVHKENRANIKALADHFGGVVEFLDGAEGMVQVEVRD